MLAIDADPQGDLSDSVDARQEDVATTYEVMQRKANITDAIQHMAYFDIVASNIQLAGIEPELLGKSGGGHRLKEMLNPVIPEYDYIIIDTPPSLSLLTLNGIIAADEIILPATPSKFAAKAIRYFYETVEETRQYDNTHAIIRGVLVTRYNHYWSTHRDMRALICGVAENFGIPVFDQFIRSSVQVEDAQGKSMNLFDFKGRAPNSVAEDYDHFIDAYINHTPPVKDFNAFASSYLEQAKNATDENHAVAAKAKSSGTKKGRVNANA